MEEKWAEFEVNVVFQKRVDCSKQVLLKQFEDAYPKMNEMARELLASKERGDKNTTQRSLWKKFITKNELKSKTIDPSLKNQFIPIMEPYQFQKYSLGHCLRHV